MASEVISLVAAKLMRWKSYSAGCAVSTALLITVTVGIAACDSPPTVRVPNSGPVATPTSVASPVATSADDYCEMIFLTNFLTTDEAKRIPAHLAAVTNSPTEAWLEDGYFIVDEFYRGARRYRAREAPESMKEIRSLLLEVADRFEAFAISYAAGMEGEGNQAMIAAMAELEGAAVVMRTLLPLMEEHCAAS